MHQTLSTLTAAKIWPASMKLSFDYFQMQPQDFPRPDGLVERQVCGDTRMRPGAPLCWNDIFFAESAPKGTVLAGPRPTAQATPQATPGADETAEQPTAQPKPQPTQARPGQPQPTAVPQPTAAPPKPQPTAAPPAQPKPTAAPPKPQPTPKPRNSP